MKTRDCSSVACLIKELFLENSRFFMELTNCKRAILRGRLVYHQDYKTIVDVKRCINCGEVACSSSPSRTCVICFPFEACDSQTIFMHVRSAARLLMPLSWEVHRPTDLICRRQVLETRGDVLGSVKDHNERLVNR